VKSHLEHLLLPYQQKYFETIETYKNKTRNLKKPKNVEEQQKIKKNLIQIQDFFFESLENQLKITEVFPNDLPKFVSILFHSNQIKINGIYIENDNIDGFLGKVQEKSMETGEPIREINKNTVSLITTSFFHKEEVEMLMDLDHNMKDDKFLRDNLLKIDGSFEYVLKNQEKFNMNMLEHGDIIVIFGDIKFKNDYPPECITYEFKGNVAWNYYSCTECKIKCNFNLFLEI